ncbi:MAG TPA: hypothetical protein PL186_04235, partial [Bacillota bacterium]|nr:hypothetical protein [Bacillota bacterium]
EAKGTGVSASDPELKGYCANLLPRHIGFALNCQGSKKIQEGVNGFRWSSAPTSLLSKQPHRSLA